MYYIMIILTLLTISSCNNNLGSMPTGHWSGTCNWSNRRTSVVADLIFPTRTRSGSYNDGSGIYATNLVVFRYGNKIYIHFDNQNGSEAYDLTAEEIDNISMSFSIVSTSELGNGFLVKQRR